MRPVLARIHAWATAAWLGLAGGAGLGFVTRDVLQLSQPEVAFSWFAGAGLGLAWASRGLRGRLSDADRSSESGQASVEWTGVLLLVTLILGALLTMAPSVEGRSFGGFLAHRFVCGVKGACRDGDRALARAYGIHDAALVRAHAPNIVFEPGERQLPVDWRRCRRPRCANGRGEGHLDVHRSEGGERATVFTRVVRRNGRAYLQYWLYYPDSNTTWAGSDRAWAAGWLVARVLGLVNDTPRYPGFHRDDWEAYVVRLEPDGSAWVRASSHGHWQGCKQRRCRGRWTEKTGWTRVSRGSHAGHIPPPGSLDPTERSSTGEGLRLIPLETHDRRRYRPNAEGISPPWQKDAYRDPGSDAS